MDLELPLHHSGDYHCHGDEGGDDGDDDGDDDDDDDNGKQVIIPWCSSLSLRALLYPEAFFPDYEVP